MNQKKNGGILGNRVTRGLINYDGGLLGREKKIDKRERKTDNEWGTRSPGKTRLTDNPAGNRRQTSWILAYREILRPPITRGGGGSA